MSTRFGRRTADGTYEYYDSKEALVAAERLEESNSRAGLFRLLGLPIGGVLAYVALGEFGVEWPKWIRFGLIVAGAGASSYLLGRFADLIWTIFGTVVLLAVLWLVGSLLWRAI